LQVNNKKILFVNNKIKMSFIASFKGTVITTLWNNQLVNPKPGNPPAPDPVVNDPTTQFRDMTYVFDQSINWSSDTPVLLITSGRTINDIFNNFQNFTLSQNYIFTATSGSQNGCGGDNVSVLLYPDTSVPTPFIQLNTVSSGNCASYQYKAPESKGSMLMEATSGNSISLQSIQAVSALPYANGVNNAITDFTLQLVLEITLSFPCNSSNIQNGICLEYCTSKTNIQNGTCLSEYTDLCFTTLAGATGPIIFENNGENGCYTFFENYLTENPDGPSVTLDGNLTAACSFLQLDQIIPFYQTPSGGATGATGGGGPLNIQNICACHLNPEFYKNLQKEIAALPGGNTVDLPDVCLFQPCVNPGSFPRVLSGEKACPVAPCIIIADINNNGTIKGGTTINQSCLNTKATIEKYLIFLVPIGIIILFVIIVILFLVFREL